jgi:hypothetical protein
MESIIRDYKKESYRLYNEPGWLTHSLSNLCQDIPFLSETIRQYPSWTDIIDGDLIGGEFN